jgi:putative phosphoesterase
MTTRIGLISDVHASPAPLRQALQLFRENQVSEIICAGDIAGYFDALTPCIKLLSEYQCKTIIGNHDQSFLSANADQTESPEYQFLHALPETIRLCIEGTELLVVHAEPPAAQHGGIKLLDKQGDLITQQISEWSEKLKPVDCDVLVVGHTHQVFAEQLGNIFAVNPGSSQFNHSCMILSLPDLRVETFALDDRPVIKAWNFSMLFNAEESYPDRFKP